MGKSCIGSVGLGLSFGHYSTTSVAFNESLSKSNLKTNGDIKKEIERTKNDPNGSFLYQTVSKRHLDEDRVVAIKQK
jgi:hypothetical protein